MNIYHLTQNKVSGYDTYSDAVVIANNEEEAKNIHPLEGYDYRTGKFVVQTLEEADDEYSWPKSAKYITAILIGTATPDKDECEVVCASFHAG